MKKWAASYYIFDEPYIEIIQKWFYKQFDMTITRGNAISFALKSIRKINTMTINKGKYRKILYAETKTANLTFKAKRKLMNFTDHYFIEMAGDYRMVISCCVQECAMALEEKTKKKSIHSS